MIDLEEYTSVSLVNEEGSEVTLTLRRDGSGMLFVSLYLDDGVNVSTILIPRYIFDQFLSEMRTMQ